MSFLDELARLNQQNFLGGAVKFGEAAQELKQNQQLTDTWNKFQTEVNGNNNLSTKDETLEKFNDYAKNLGGLSGANNSGQEVVDTVNDMVNSNPVKEQYNNTTDYSKTGLPVTDKTVRATLDVIKYINNMEGIQKTYTPYIAAFSMLGEQGRTIASILNEEKSTKMQLEQLKAEAPTKELQFQTMQLQYEKEQNELSDYYKQKRDTEDGKRVMNIMYGSQLFQVFNKYQGGWNYHDANKKKVMLESFTKDKQSVSNMIADQFAKQYGYAPEPRMVEGAVQEYLKTLGININYSQRESTGVGNYIGNTTMRAGDLVVGLTQLTNMYNRSDILASYRRWVANKKGDAEGVSFQRYMKDQTSFTEEAVRNFYNTYGPQGTYENMLLTFRSVDMQSGSKYFDSNGYLHWDNNAKGYYTKDGQAITFMSNKSAGGFVEPQSDDYGHTPEIYYKPGQQMNRGQAQKNINNKVQSKTSNIYNKK